MTQWQARQVVSIIGSLWPAKLGDQSPASTRMPLVLQGHERGQKAEGRSRQTDRQTTGSKRVMTSGVRSGAVGKLGVELNCNKLIGWCGD